MAVVTQTELFGICITAYDDEPFEHFLVEGNAPYVPTDDGPGWVYFEVWTAHLTQPQAMESLQEHLTQLRFTPQQIEKLTEDF